MGRLRELSRDKPWAPGCLIAIAGVLLGVSGCFGFLLTLNFSGGPSRAGADILGFCCGALFVLGALALPVGFIWWIVGLVKTRSRADRQVAPSPPESAPPPPPGA